MRIVNVNLNSGKSISASIKSSEIKSVDVILNGKIQEIPVDKFWNYDAMVNILGDED